MELAKLQAELKCCCEKQEDNVFMMAKHKLLEAIEKRNKESYHTEGDIRAYKDALKALYYLISIEKSK